MNYNRMSIIEENGKNVVKKVKITHIKDCPCGVTLWQSAKVPPYAKTLFSGNIIDCRNFIKSCGAVEV